MWDMQVLQEQKPVSSIIQTFEADFLVTYPNALPSPLNALDAMKKCRTTLSPLMRAECETCEHPCFIPHSCGHRSCLHCPHYESEQWLQRQLKKQLPAEYFLLTFTLPAELRPLAWQHQRMVYDLRLRCSWETLKTFARNDAQLHGEAGAISVLHTHNRRLDFHPHVQGDASGGSRHGNRGMPYPKKQGGECLLSVQPHSLGEGVPRQDACKH
jgi:hypothetical protein